MGYRRSTLLLAFTDEQYDGLEVRMRRLPLGDMFAVAELAELGDTIAEQQESLDALLSTLADNLISWNIEDDEGRPVPIEKGGPSRPVDGGGRLRPTGLYALDIELVLAIVTTWLEALAGVAPPLHGRSTSGQQSPEEFELMAALSQSQ